MAHGSVKSAGANAGELFQSSDEVVQARRIGDAIPCLPGCERMLRVLVVDDDHDCANSLTMLIRLWGHEVQTAYNGSAALEIMGARQPDVALVDLGMPEMDGCRMGRRLRRQSRFNHTLMIAITGYADQAHRLLCDEAGFDHCLIKPIELASLEILLRSKRDRLAGSADRNENLENTQSERMKTEVRDAL